MYYCINCWRYTLWPSQNAFKIRALKCVGLYTCKKYNSGRRPARRLDPDTHSLSLSLYLSLSLSLSDAMIYLSFWTTTVSINRNSRSYEIGNQIPPWRKFYQKVRLSASYILSPFFTKVLQAIIIGKQLKKQHLRRKLYWRERERERES